MIMTILSRRYAALSFMGASSIHLRTASSFTFTSKKSSSSSSIGFVRSGNIHLSGSSIGGNYALRLNSSVAPEAERAVTEKIPGSGIENSFYGEAVSHSKNLVAIRVSDAQVQAMVDSLVQDVTGAATGEKKARDEDMTGKLVSFETDEDSVQEGVIVCQRPPVAFVLLKDEEYASVTSSSDKPKVHVSDKKMTITASDDLVGKVVDCFGNVLKSNKNNEEMMLSKTYERAIFATIPQVKDIALIDEPMLTGISMVDALAPIGKGQNMLVVGERGTGKRALVIDAMRNQIKLKGARCIYACTSTNEDEKKAIMNSLKEANILDEITVVSLKKGLESLDKSEEPSIAAEAVTVCGTACALAEAWALNEGLDCFVVIDNLSLHKSLWEHSSRTLVDMYGEEAIVADDRGASSEMRAYYSSLIQRSAQYKEKIGGGSVTLALLNELPGMKYDAESEIIFELEDFADSTPKIRERIEQLVKAKIPITPKVLRKIQLPIPTQRSSDDEKLRQWALIHTDDLISMSDGQIWLSEDRFNNGQRPALDPQQSITRVGIGADTISFADAPAIRKIVKGLRFELNQAASLDGATNDAATRKQLQRFNSWMLAMHQSDGVILDLAEECICLLAASLGALDEIVVAEKYAGSYEGSRVLEDLLETVRSTIPQVLDEINSSLDMTDSNKELLERAIMGHFDV